MFDADIEDLPAMAAKDLESQPGFIKLYVAFFVITIILYVFNVLMINPITCIFKEGFCWIKKEKKLDRKSKHRRAKKIIEKIRENGYMGPTITYS